LIFSKKEGTVSTSLPPGFRYMVSAKQQTLLLLFWKRRKWADVFDGGLLLDWHCVESSARGGGFFGFGIVGGGGSFLLIVASVGVCFAFPGVSGIS
jgi:hypothetical protein